MNREIESIDDRVRRLEQRVLPPRYSGLDQVSDLFAAARMYRHIYGSTAGYVEELKRLLGRLPKAGRDEIKFLAQLVKEVEELKPQPQGDETIG